MGKFKIRRVLLVGMVMLCSLSGCMKSVPNEKKISKDLIMEEANIIKIGNQKVSLEVDGVSINKRQTNNKKDITYITVQLKNEALVATRSLVLTYNYYDKGGWILDRFEDTNKITFVPLKGVSNAEVESVLSVKYKSHQQISHNTDLVSKSDVLVYEFSQETDTCNATGRTSLTYNFAAGIWNPSNSIEEVTSIEWHPTGQWRFDINTFYVRVNILSLDTTNKKISLQFDGSVWQSEADKGAMESAILGYTETSEGLLVDTFSIYYGGWFVIDKEVTLRVSRDTMYFMNAYGKFTPVNWPRN